MFDRLRLLVYLLIPVLIVGVLPFYTLFALSVDAMFNTEGKYINPTDVFNKKAALEMINDRKKFDKKVKHLVKKYANQKW